MNQFNQSLDWLLKGKYVEVSTEEYLVRGWVERVHHKRGSLVLHDGERKKHPKHAPEDDDWSPIGGAFIRTPNAMMLTKPEQGKEIKMISPDITVPFPDHPLDFDPVDSHIRNAYRNQYTGSYPVVRELPETHEEYDTNDRYQIINGHKRLEAARVAGLQFHPVEVLRCTDAEAYDLFHVAHKDELRLEEKRDEVRAAFASDDED